MSNSLLDYVMAWSFVTPGQRTVKIGRQVALELQILGPLEAEGDRGPLALGGRRQRALLALLLLYSNEFVSRDRLLEELWPDAAPESAQRNLTVYVSALRKALGAEAHRLRTRAGGYLFALEPDELDAARFERLLAEGKEALAAGDAERAATVLQSALSLWRGQALGDLAYEPFASTASARLDELRLVALEERIEAELVLGRHGPLVGELEALVARERLRERLYAQLMLALYRSGRQADALTVFHDARRVLGDELGLEPSAQLSELQQAILRQDAALHIEPPELRARRHLPAAREPLIGRRAELDELEAMLRNEGVRLVTLTGPGGIGKTRLALQTAHDLADTLPDGAWFVELAQLRDPLLVAPTIASALGLDGNGGPPLETLVEHLRARRSLLLLDSFEVVVDAAPVVAELLAAAAGLVVLATSRRTLGLYGEQEYPVRSLALEEEAVPLFVARARRSSPTFRRTDDNAEALRQICKRLDCLPLAIELVAARSRELTLDEMLPLLGRPLELAAGGARDLPARQKTLRATVEWSYELLAPEEQLLFARLSIFAGGCTVATAEEVCGATRTQLLSLAWKSLLVDSFDPGGERRFDMLDTVREYARERLDATEETFALRERHARHFLALAERFDEDVVAGVDARPWRDRFAADHDNLRAALLWSQTNAPELGLRLAAALRFFWQVRGHLGEGRRWTEAALSTADDAPPEARAFALVALGGLAYRQVDVAEAKRRWNESLALYRDLDDRTAIARSLADLANVATIEGDFERARALYEESVAIFRADDDGLRLGQSLANLADLALHEGEYDGAAELLEEAVAIQTAVADKDGLTATIFTLGRAELFRGAVGRARELFLESLALADEVGYPELAAYCLSGLGEIELAAGTAERAARLLAAAEAVLEHVGARFQPLDQRSHDAAGERAAGSLGEETFARAWAAGQALGLDAIGEVLAGAPGYA